MRLFTAVVILGEYNLLRFSRIGAFQLNGEGAISTGRVNFKVLKQLRASKQLASEI